MFETLLVFGRHVDLDYGYPLAGSSSLGPLITEKTHFKRGKIVASPLPPAPWPGKARRA